MVHTSAIIYNYYFRNIERHCL